MAGSLANNRSLSVRVGAGILGSRRIRAPRGSDIRPTPERARLALFSILADRVVNARFLDLYAGSGAVGFEALSRGAREVVFVEIDGRTTASLRATAENFGVADRAMVLRADASQIASRLHDRFDLIFADPPFAQSAPYQALESLRACGCLDGRSLIIYERRYSAPAFACPGWRNERTERYGEVALEFLRFDG